MSTDRVPGSNARQLRAVWLGRQSYGKVHDLQRELHERRRQERIGDTVLLCEHQPVITLGRGSLTQHLLASEGTLAQIGVELAQTGRGGDITLHAPGQLVCYPIVNLAPERRDVRRYVQDLTCCMRRVAADSNVAAGAHPDYVGLWVDAASPQHWPGHGRALRLAKIGAIGVRISRWITMHGFALNLGTDLELFKLIVPCGIAEYPVTSISALIGSAVPVAPSARRAAGHLAAVLAGTLERYDDLSRGEAEVERWLDLITASSRLGP